MLLGNSSAMGISNYLTIVAFPNVHTLQWLNHLWVLNITLSANFNPLLRFKPPVQEASDTTYIPVIPLM